MRDEFPESGIGASSIPVNQFREILIWPLSLHVRPAAADAQAVQAAVTASVDEIMADPRKCWKAIDDPSEHIVGPDTDKAQWRAERYAEGVYFHDFVQNFLFSPREPRGVRNPDPVPFRLFRRDDVGGVTLRLAGVRERLFEFSIERLNLYLFRTGVAILALEIASQPDAKLRLSDVQDILEQFRLAYVPYAESGSKPPKSGIRVISWLLTDGDRRNFEVKDVAVEKMIESYLDQTEPDPSTGLKRRSPPLFEHWNFLLANALPLASNHPWDGARSRWHHVVDERMPFIAAISVTQPKNARAEQDDGLFFFSQTQRGDLMRLCFADGADGKRALPYDRRGMLDFEADHTYRAFQDRGTLFLASGYAFVAYGAGGFFDDLVAAVHIRRHYFQICLLAHLESASLLSFSSRISRAVAEFNPASESEEKFEQRMQVIEEEYLQFVHRFRFTGASNHPQAAAITALLRRHLRLNELFEDLHTEITSATEYLFNRATSRGAATAERLTIIGTLGLLGALTFSFLGMNILTEPNDLLTSFGFS